MQAGGRRARGARPRRLLQGECQDPSPMGAISAWPLLDAATQGKATEGTAVPQMRRASHMRLLVQKCPADFSASDSPERGARLDTVSKGCI